MNQEVNIDPLPPRILGRTERLFQTAFSSGFDHLVKGDVIIKKLKNKHQYKITFSKVYGDRFFFYQVFNKDNTDNVNDQRFAAYIPIKYIDKLYKNLNTFNTIFNKPLFTPTTIMELENFHKHAFVINKVYFNSHKRLVFMVSTKEIKLQNNSLKKLTQIPSGKFKHVRFDVDAYTDSGLKKLWNTTDNICKNDPNAVFTNDKGTSYPYCNKPLPPFPEVCDDASGSKDVIKCKTVIGQMLRDRTLPDSLLYAIAQMYSCSPLVVR
jgi:hypothetical protein